MHVAWTNFSWHAQLRMIEYHLSNYERELADVQAKINILHDGLETISEEELQNCVYKSVHPAQRRIYLKRLKLYGRRQSLLSSIDFLKRKMNSRQVFPESGVVGPSGSGQVEIRDETVSDSSGLDIFLHSAGKTTDINVGQKEEQGVQGFLSRPVIIHSDSHAVGSTFNEILDVWDLFTRKPSIRAKLRNFAYLRATLKLRVSISGTSFHAGRVLLSYQPFASANPTLSTLYSMATVDPATYRRCLLNYLSQAHGAITMNVNENKPVEMTIPFIFPRPLARLFDGSVALAAASPYPDMEAMGSLYVQSINELTATGTADTPVYMQVYAWFEDVELGTSTATQTVITTESGELKTGPIEKIASRLVKVSQAAMSIPYLKPYATASGMIFGGVRYIASHMGWSRPVVVDDEHTVYLKPQANTALTIGKDSAYRVVLDPCQELSVSNMYSGVDQDEMVIANIANRASYLGTVQWETTDTALTTLLFNSYVHPNLNTIGNGISHYLVQPTAMAYACMPFQYWRGDIVFRFEVVSTGFHRGKIAIVYEPNPEQLGLTAITPQINKQYVQIIDIQETNTFEVVVNWASARNWLSNIPVADVTSVVDNPLLPSKSPDEYNGWIGVYPFTSLQSSDGSGVSINVYAYSPNLQVNALTSANMFTDRTLISPESGVVPASPPVMLQLNHSSADPTHICEEHFGEQPLSFRALLKRYVTTKEISPTSAVATLKTFKHTFNIYYNNLLPYGSGAFVVYDLFSYLRYAYLGVRGGMRYRLSVEGAVSGTGNDVRFNLEQATSSTTSTTTWDATIRNRAKLEGSATHTYLQNHSACAEFPFYSNNAWVFAPNDDLLDDSARSTFDPVWFRQASITFPTSTATFTGTTGNMMFDTATAEDFSLIKFLGSPWYSIVK